MVSQATVDRLMPYLYKSEDNILTTKTDRHTVLWFTHGCQYDHVFPRTLLSAMKTTKCSYCHGNATLSGFNDFASQYPELAKEWDYERNNTTPDKIRKTRSEKFFWICPKEGHSYDMLPVARIDGQNCPYCSGKRALAGFNDLASKYPELLDEWDYEKNNKLGIYPDKVTYGSFKRVWWKHTVDGVIHSWDINIVNRTSGGYGCPYCYNKVLSGVNDIMTTHKDIVEKFWDFEKNNKLGIHPEDVSFGSEKKVWWKCSNELDHSYQTLISSKLDGRECTFCSSRKVLKGLNDFASQFPELAKEWDYQKNTVHPDEILQFSPDEVWFHCPQGHSYSIPLCYRTRNGSQCTKCSKRRSLVEIKVCDFIESVYSGEVMHNAKIDGAEVDIYIPDKNIAVEVNGVYWHSDKCQKDFLKHYKKWKLCKDNNIQLITLWEDDISARWDIVCSLLKHKLDIDDSERIYARSTYIEKISSRRARSFLNKYHIQGDSKGSVYYGLMDQDDDLVAVSVWRKNKNVLYLDRYATSCTVVGGMGKFLKAGIQYARDNNLTQIVTFSDHEVSDGGLYQTLGFTLDKEMAPDYKYIYDHTRCHKFGFRKIRFKNDPELIYFKELTEAQLAELNGIPKVHDCGKTRWVINL